MTTITLREAAQQVLEALEYAQQGRECPSTTRQAITALRAALAQQAEPVEPVAGVVLNEEGRAALVEYGREEWHCAVCNARRLHTAPPKDEPKPMHPELRKMWEGYFDKCFRAMPVPKQAEPVAWLQPKTVDGHLRPDLGYETCSKTDYGAFSVYTAPPQRQPLTKEEIESCRQKGYAHAGLGAPFDFGKAARAVERAHGIKE